MLRNTLITICAAIAVCSAANAEVGTTLSNLNVQSYSAPQARDARNSGDVLPALRVISIVRNRYPSAEVLDAQLQRGSSPRYIVTILTREGRRVDVIVDAQTGRILGER